MERGLIMREQLKKARQEAGMTQQEVADKLHVGLRYYKSLESGERLGGIELWDELEDLFKIHQRKLREISKNHHDQEDSR
jgi:transcriptional regulator with XRE-family HTH domain